MSMKSYHEQRDLHTRDDSPWEVKFRKESLEWRHRRRSVFERDHVTGKSISTHEYICRYLDGNFPGFIFHKILLCDLHEQNQPQHNTHI